MLLADNPALGASTAPPLAMADLNVPAVAAVVPGPLGAGFAKNLTNELFGVLGKNAVALIGLPLPGFEAVSDLGVEASNDAGGVLSTLALAASAGRSLREAAAASSSLSGSTTSSALEDVAAGDDGAGVGAGDSPGGAAAKEAVIAIKAPAVTLAAILAALRKGAEVQRLAESAEAIWETSSIDFLSSSLADSDDGDGGGATVAEATAVEPTAAEVSGASPPGVELASIGAAVSVSSSDEYLFES